MSIINGSFAPQDDDSPRFVLVEADLFLDLVDALSERENLSYDIEMGTPYRGTITYYEPTIYETEPHPDPLDVTEPDTG